LAWWHDFPVFRAAAAAAVHVFRCFRFYGRLWLSLSLSREESNFMIFTVIVFWRDGGVIVYLAWMEVAERYRFILKFAHERRSR
jgi:hypothetical protein